MEDLIKQLKTLTAPDTWLDCKIREAVEGWKNIGGGWREWPDGRRETYDYGFARPYTASIDAALTLVPDGFSCDTQSYYRGSAIFDKPQAWAQVEEICGSFIVNQAGATLPIVICIVALKARDNQALTGR